MVFELFCMTLIALVIGMAVCFNGYRWFLIILPIAGFVFGFGLGAQTLQALFGIGFLATASSWIVGFFAGLVFAVLSYLFYMVGVALVAGSWGYGLGVGLMGLIGLGPGIIPWLVGLVFGVVVALITLGLNIQKWIIIAVTSFSGAGIIVGTLLFALGIVNPADLGTGAVQEAIHNSFLWLIFYLVLGILGFAAQAVTTSGYVLEAPESPIAV
jgi:hypothetical protein